MSAATASVSSVNEKRMNPWWVTLLSGIALVAISIWLWTSPIQTSLFLVQVLGWYFIFTGILNLVMIFVDSHNWGWKLVMGIIGIAAGLWVVNNPIQGAIGVVWAFVFILGLQAIIYGIMAMIAGFQGGGWGAIVLGIVAIVLGFLLLGNIWAAAVVTPWVIAIFAFVGGIAEIVVSFRQRSMQKA